MRSPRTIAITGASSGIGAALARHYAAPGVTLALTGRDPTRLRAVTDDCTRKGARVLAERFDITDAEAVAGWLARVEAEAPIDLLIANAGISAGPMDRRIEPPEQVRALWRTNVEGVMNAVLPVISPMIARGRGQIALMSSLAGFRGMPGAPAYSMSKAAVRIWGEALHGQLAPLGVTVSVICPGFVATPLTAVNRFPMPFLMTPETAAARIATGLAAGRGLIAFPRRMAWPTRLLAALPAYLTDLLFARLPRKG